MATFPAPDLERRTFQTLPEAGSPLTETELLQLLYDFLKPLEAIHYAFVIAHDEMSTGEATTIMVEFFHEIMEQVVLLLDAWHDHQPPPGRRRGTPQAAPAAAEPWPGADNVDDDEEAEEPPPPTGGAPAGATRMTPTPSHTGVREGPPTSHDTTAPPLRQGARDEDHDPEDSDAPERPSAPGHLDPGDR